MKCLRHITAHYMNLARKVRWNMQFAIIFLLRFYKHKILHSHDDPCLHSVLNTFSSICTKPSVLQRYRMGQCVHIMVGELCFPDSGYNPRQVDGCATWKVWCTSNRRMDMQHLLKSSSVFNIENRGHPAGCCAALQTQWGAYARGLPLVYIYSLSYSYTHIFQHCWGFIRINAQKLNSLLCNG